MAVPFSDTRLSINSTSEDGNALLGCKPQSISNRLFRDYKYIAEYVEPLNARRRGRSNNNRQRARKSR